VSGHLGFDPEFLSAKLQVLDFTEISYEPCYVMRKETASGEMKDFPLFLLVAKTS